jgi:hypothetical protein
MCALYNLIDLYVIPTRWEGAPRQIFDVIECRRKIISTRVGVVPEILPDSCLFDSLSEGVHIIRMDMVTDFLSNLIDDNRTVVTNRYAVSVVGDKWRSVYEKIMTGAVGNRHRCRDRNKYGGPTRYRLWSGGCFVLRNVIRVAEHPLLRSLKNRLFGKTVVILSNHRKDRTGVFHLIKKGLENRGVHIDARVFSGAVVLVRQAHAGRAKPLGSRRRIVHFIDAPCARLLSKRDPETVDRFRAIQHLAAATIVTDDLGLARLAASGLTPKNPVVVRFPPDPDIFFPSPENGLAVSDKTRCIVLAGNERTANGKWIAELSDGPVTDRFEPTIISHPAKPESAMRAVHGLRPETRAGLARRNEFFVALPGANDHPFIPELLACGLPGICHREMADLRKTVGMAGLDFRDGTELREQMATMSENLTAFKTTVTPPRLEDALVSVVTLFNQA